MAGRKQDSLLWPTRGDMDIFNYTQKNNFPNKRERVAYRYMLKLLVIDIFSTYCYKIVLFRLPGKFILVDLDIFYLLVLNINDCHKSLINTFSSKFEIHHGAEECIFLHDSQRITSVSKTILEDFKLNLHALAYNSLVCKLYNFDDRRFFIEKIFKHCRLLLKRMTLCKLIEKYKQLKSLSKYQMYFKRKQDFITIIIASYYFQV